ncbi:MAG: hypothetical protein CSA76_04015 [Spirochaetales bacterium]|nr:MAG: hypothetical protein CSA76_04015 [Spirochaetales bacterium]
MKYRIPVVKKIIVIAAVMLLGTLLPAFGATFNWTGAVSTDWDTPGNWDSGSVPGSGDGVNIPSGTPHAPALSSDVAIAGLVITPTASLTLNNYNLTVTSDTLLAGSITGTNSNITLGTVGASTLYLSGNITTVSGNIDINHVNITAAPAATPQIVTGIGNIDLHGLVDSTDLTPRNLTVAAGGAGGTLTLNQDVGSLRALGTVNFHASAIHLGAGLSSLSATDFTFSGAIELTADTSFNFSGTSLVFNCPIDSDTAGPWDLTVTAGGAGILTLDQDVGGVRALGTVNFHAPVIHLGAGLSSLSATDFTFSGAIELTADTSFNFSGTSLVFNCTIDSNTAGPWNLTVAAGGAGTLTLNQNVGGTHVLGTVNLSANPPGTPGIFLGAPILAVDISIAGNIALTADCGLEADPVAGTIGIGNISGNFNFVMAAGGQITFNGTTGNIDLTGANNTVLILDSDQNISSSSHIIKVHSLYLTHQSSPPTPPPATSLNNISNDVEVIASDRSGAFVFRNSDALEIGSVSPPFGGPVINGITTSNSDIFVGTRSGILTVNQPVSSGTGAGNISLQARNTTVPVTTYTNLNINSVVDAGNGNITLRGTPVNLGFGLRGHDIDLGIIDIVLTNHITLNAVGTITFGGTLKSDPSGPWDLFINAGGASVALNGDVGNPGVPPAFKPVKNLNVAAASVNLAAGISFNLSENLTIQGGCTFNANNSSMNIGGSVTGAGILNGQTSSITIGRHLSIGTFNCVTSSVKFNSGLFAAGNKRHICYQHA